MLGKQQNIRIEFMSYLRWIPALVVMGIIFAFSHATAEVSAGMSGSITSGIRIYLEQLVPYIKGDGNTIDTMEYIVRKLAHLTEYAVLGASLCYALYGRDKMQVTSPYKAGIMAVVISACYAITDEIHQLFIPGRSGQVSDVFIDTMGAIIGIALYMGGVFCIKIIGRRRRGV